MSASNMLIFVIAITFLRCNNVEIQKSKNEYAIIKELDFPTIIETDSSSEMKKKEEMWFGVGTYQVSYIGNLIDTIVLDYKLNPIIPPPLPTDNDSNYQALSFPDKYPDYYLEWNDSRYYVEADSTPLVIKIDTLQKINDNGIYSYPILILNSSNDTVTIGYGNRIRNYIPLTLEALDNKKNWLPVELAFTFACGNGVGSIILPPNEIVISSTNLQSGVFKTRLRIRLGMNISNEFLGYIDTTQFKQEIY